MVVANRATTAILPDAVKLVIAVARGTLAARPVRAVVLAEDAVVRGIIVLWLMVKVGVVRPAQLALGTPPLLNAPTPITSFALERISAALWDTRVTETLPTLQHAAPRLPHHQ